ncbi:uncharacterized protein LOC112056780 [Bicyclus anynana]|uniref:Regulatory protein zeste n=1 Tax=Bicyclus anynana TaxID=110368 RepID=A0A6J1P5E8_BICAN|nr:uncharacterized protein LOC112056780 [Bicyclus anynana]XP_052742843.1 uncharacterized protein LOC112056780 [Bicyclus anynana]XP_052742845.1 uncharacterized protein LOC112056780 [Bicyclus anynana]
MAENKIKRKVFTAEEKEKLVMVMDPYIRAILNKKTDGPTNRAKNEAWLNVCTSFNSTGTTASTARSKDSLIRVWEKIKREAKIYKKSWKTGCNGTGGGPPVIDPFLEQVCDLIGRGCSGTAGDQDSDTESISSLMLDETLECSVHTYENDNTSNTEQMENKEIDHNYVISATQLSQSTAMKRRPIVRARPTRRTEVVKMLCGGFKDLNSKKAIAESIKIKILEEELEFKRDLHKLQLKNS